MQIVYCVFLAFEFGFLYMYLIETKGRTLEETAALFDGEDAVKELHDAAAGGVVDEKASDSFREDEKAKA